MSKGFTGRIGSKSNMSGGCPRFFCLCSSKEVDTVENNDAKQKQKDEELQQQLNRVDLGASGKIVLSLPGGGIASEGMGTDPEVAVDGHLLAVLAGTLSNYAYLIRKYFVEELGYARNVSLESIRQSSPIRDAALLCKLYEKLGMGMLPKLRGPFCFCLYDSSMRRVLTARDPTCSSELIQGETKEGSLFVSAGGFRPEGCTKVKEILPGEFKYGWRSGPRKYANPQVDVDTCAAVASDAARAALSGIKLNGKGPRPNKVQASEDVPKVPVVPEGPKLKTKRELRAWSALIAQEAIKSYESEWVPQTVFQRNCGAVSVHQPFTGFSSWAKGRRKTLGFASEARDWDLESQSHVYIEQNNLLSTQFQPQVLASLLGSSDLSGSAATKDRKHERAGNSSPSNESRLNSSQGNTSCNSSITPSESSSSLSTETLEKAPQALQSLSDDKRASACIM